MTSSPGSQSTANAVNTACLPPLVTSTLAGPHVEPGVPLGLDRDGLPQLRQPARRRVAVVLRVPAGGDRRLHDVLRGREVGLAGTEADDVLARRLQGLGLGVDGQGGRLGDGADPLGDAGLGDGGHGASCWHSDLPPRALQIPADAAAARRPLRLRSVEGPPRGDGGPGRGRPELDGHVATARRRCGTSSREVRAGLRELFALPDGWEVVLGNGGSTAFWDVATFGLIERRSQHLVFGEFSGKFADAAARAPHLDAPEIVAQRARHPPGARSPTPASTSTRSPTTRPRPACMMDLRRPDGRRRWSSVDATSGAGGLPWSPAEVDVYYFAPQKCFGSDGGLWLALLLPRRARAHRTRSPRRAAGCRPRSICASPSRTAAPTRPTTPPRWRRCSCSPTSCGGCSGTAG